MFDVAQALREVTNSRYSDTERQAFLKCISLSFSKLNKIEIQDIQKTVAPAIHYIFVNYRDLRVSLLKTCCDLERKVEHSITERCHIDHLIAWYFAQEEDLSETVDTVYEYVNTLLRLRKRVPEAVLRALVVHYNLPEQSANHAREEEKPKLIAIFREAARYPGNLETVPEITEILMKEYLNNGGSDFLWLVNLAIEEGLALVSDSRSLWSLASALSEQSVKGDNSREAVLHLLRTWPGLLCFGIQGGGIHNLVQFRSTGPGPVLSILQKSLLFNGTQESVTDPVTGFLFASLLQEHIIENLNAFRQDSSVAEFLVHMLPYTTHKHSSELDTVGDIPSRPLNVPMSMLFKDEGSGKEPEKIESLIEDIEAMIKKPKEKWDWGALLVFLSEFVPTMEKLGDSVTWICKKLLDFFSQDFLRQKWNDQLGQLAETLYALLRCLMGKRAEGYDIIRNSTSFANAFDEVLAPKGTQIEEESEMWVLFKCLPLLLSNAEGTFALGTMKGKDHATINQKLVDFCARCTNDSDCQLIINVFMAQAQRENLVPVLLAFLNASPQMHKTVINYMRERWRSIPGALDTIFAAVLLTEIKVSDFGDAKKSKSSVTEEEVLLLDLNFFGEILIREPKAIELALNDRGYGTIEACILANCRFLFALFTPCAAVLTKEWVQREVDWWISQGCTEYVKLYDRAIRRAYGEIMPMDIATDAAIFEIHKTIITPPHLFREISRTQEGFDKIKPHVQSLLDKLTPDVSILDARAIMLALGHLGSSEFADEIVASAKIPEKLFLHAQASSSYAVKGTLIAALSMFRVTPYFINFMNKRGFYLFNFGHRKCVIPRDPLAWLGERVSPCPAFAMYPDIPEFAHVTHQLRQLTNPLFDKKELQTMQQTQAELRRNSNLALYAHNIMGSYLTSPAERRLIYLLFHNVPMLAYDPKPGADTADSAAMAAKLHYAMIKNTVIILQVPHLPIDEIRAMQPRPRCPEQFLSNELFQKLAKCTPTEFYRKSASAQEAIRADILSHN